jgi:hypothetical protein
MGSGGLRNLTELNGTLQKIVSIMGQMVVILLDESRIELLGCSRSMEFNYAKERLSVAP